MSFFAHIFTIYILALSLLPCNDVYVEYQNDIAKTELTQPHNQRTEHNDACSPFCTCSCCSTYVILKFEPSLINIFKPDAGTTLKYPIRNFSFVSAYSGNIWQPPKVNA